MIAALALSATLAACHADMLAHFDKVKELAIKAYPRAADALERTVAAVGEVPSDRYAQVVYGGSKPKLPKGWGFVPIDYTNRITLSPELCDVPAERRYQSVRHEIGHVLARAERGQWIVDSEDVADAYGNTLQTP